jgi:hypothetical protein
MCSGTLNLQKGSRDGGRKLGRWSLFGHHRPLTVNAWAVLKRTNIGEFYGPLRLDIEIGDVTYFAGFKLI